MSQKLTFPLQHQPASALPSTISSHISRVLQTYSQVRVLTTPSKTFRNNLIEQKPTPSRFAAPYTMVLARLSVAPRPRPLTTGNHRFCDDFAPKWPKLWKTLFNLFWIWGRHGGWHKYFVHVFGVITCFFIELSKPIFDFRFFHNIFLVFLKNFSISGSDFRHIFMYFPTFCLREHIFPKYPKILWKNRKSKIRLRQFFKKIWGRPKNVNKILVSSTMLSPYWKNV